MSIEFRCTHCDRLLRVPDGTAGKEAKCPQCGAIVRIPAESAPLAPPPMPELAPLLETGNPYQSPGATAMAAGPQGEIHRGFHPTRIEMGDMLARTWQIFKMNMWPCVGVATFLLAVCWGAAFALAVVTAGRQPTVSERMLNFVLAIVQTWLTLGQMNYLLKIARGESAVFADLFSGGPYLLRFFGIWILISLMAFIGFILLIIPGFIVLMMFGPAVLVLIDKNTGVMDSLKMSRQATAGNKLTLFALYVIAVFGGGMFTVLTCLVGAVFMQPFVTLVFCVSYLAMTGQTTADERYVPSM